MDAKPRHRLSACHVVAQTLLSHCSLPCSAKNLLHIQYMLLRAKQLVEIRHILVSICCCHLCHAQQTPFLQKSTEYQCLCILLTEHVKPLEPQVYDGNGCL